MRSVPMITAGELVKLVGDYNPRVDSVLLRDAYQYSREMHHGQYRRSGEDYFTHPVAVALILAEQKLDDATIATALLHDTIEDTCANYGTIEAKFGGEIARLVDGVTKLTQLDLGGTEVRQAENFRKLFMAMSEDLRVILVKLSDRLHNMRTIKALEPEKRKKKAVETMEIYAPLAGRMGMHWMREELEDIAFEVTSPDVRESIMHRFDILKAEAEDMINRITSDMQKVLEEAGIEAQVIGREKKPYSIWRKMQEKNIGFARLSDIYGFRVITGSVNDCYAILGEIHRQWRAVPGRFKDYISQPKSNGYRSIHTTVLGRAAKRVEMQIRTRDMHEVAESGVAAHWSYRDGVKAENPYSADSTLWLSSLRGRFDEESHEDFLEAVKLEMYADKVFCFTPKGDVVKLPQGATLIDFAYAIHTRIGHACVGAKVDGMLVPLWTQIKNGQSVEVITAEGQTPQEVWLSIAKTGKARSAIKRSLKDLDRSRYIKLGRALARSAFEQIGKRASDRALDTAARTLGLEDRYELMVRMGRGELYADSILNAVYPDISPKEGSEVSWANAVIGLETDQRFERARCCQPLPGERIVGIMFRGKGVVIHAIDCDALVEYENQPERWVDIYWHGGKHPASYAVTLEMTIGNDSGVLGRICTLIGERKANISDLKIVDRKPDFYRLEMDVEFRDVEQMHALISLLDIESNVAEVARSRDPKRVAGSEISHA